MHNFLPSPLFEEMIHAMDDKARKPLSVYTMLGKAGLDLSLTCLGSLVEMARESLAIHVLDDGTLGAGELRSLQHSLPVKRILSKAERDAEMAQVLRQYPHWKAFRENYLNANKLDLLVLAEEPFVYLDSDVLFVRPFTGLDPSRLPGDVAFMWNPPYNMNFDGTRLAPAGSVKMARNVNTGIIICRRKPINLDHLDEWLAMPENSLERKKQGTMEQECWAWLVARGGLMHRLLDRKQVIFPMDEFQHLRNVVGLHFTRVRRHFFKEVQQRSNRLSKRRDRPPVTLKTRTGQLMTSDGFRRHQQWQVVEKRLVEPIQQRIRPLRGRLRQAGL